MKNTWLICLGLCLLYMSQTPSKAQNIEDKALLKCVNSALKKQGIDNQADFNQLKRLKCHKKDIASVAGIEAFTGLEYLSLFANDIKQADLRALKQLTYLNLAKNKLSSLQISQLNDLETLFLFNNRLKTLDLSGLSALKKFRMMQNRLASLDLSGAFALEEVYLWDNQLEDLDITPLKNLQFMDVKQNPMPDELYDFFDEQEGVVISHDGNADDWK